MLHKTQKTVMGTMLLVLFLATSVFAGAPNADLAEKLAMADINHQFLRAVQGKLEQLSAGREFRQKIIDYAPDKKIAAFLQAVEEAKYKGIDTERLLKSKTEKMKALSASISGTINVAGAEVFAFGKHGFFAGYTKADAAGKFHINGLKDGDYFLYTKTDRYRAYNPVKASPLSNELSLIASDLKPVELSLGANQDEGATISGLVTDTAGDSLNFALVFAYNTADTSLGANLGLSVEGSYTLADLEAGSYILYADSYFEFALLDAQLNARLGQYFEGASTPAEATVLTVAANEELTDKDFELGMGGAISGTVKDETGAAVDSIFVIAINSVLVDALEALFSFSIENLALDNFSGFFLENIDLAMTVADASGNYVLPGLRAGEYVVGTFSLLNADLGSILVSLLGGGESSFLGKHAGRILDEYYGGAQSIFEIGNATPVSVTESVTMGNINFDLELAGSIAGNFTDAGTSNPLQGEGLVLAFNEENNYPQLAFTIFDSASAAYSVQPLRTGSYKLLGIAMAGDLLEGLSTSKTVYDTNLLNLVQQEDVLYLPQFYNNQVTYEDANAVAVTQPNATTGINFNMQRAANLAGNISFPDGWLDLGLMPDTLEINVVAYENQSGQVAATSSIYANESFSMNLPAGTYKVAVVSDLPQVSTAYAGGGTAFDDQNSMEISIEPGESKDLAITMTSGSGSISGTVSDANGEQISGVLVIAYDQTGHAVGGAISGFSYLSPVANPGDYTITGLVSGSYYVRTFSLFQVLLLLGDTSEDNGDTDILTLILGSLLGGGTNPLSDLEVTFYNDIWYDGEPFDLKSDFGDIDIYTLLSSLLLNEADLGFVMPFFSTPASGAMAVTVSSSGETGGIDFNLTETDLGGLTGVETAAGQIPAGFALEQNYPNPFNPTTVINYTVPETGQISLQIYNILGQKIKTLFTGLKNTGTHSIQWNGLNENDQQVAAGIYVVRLESENTVLSRKMLLIK